MQHYNTESRQTHNTKNDSQTWAESNVRIAASEMLREAFEQSRDKVVCVILRTGQFGKEIA